MRPHNASEAVARWAAPEGPHGTPQAGSPRTASPWRSPGARGSAGGLLRPSGAARGAGRGGAVVGRDSAACTTACHLTRLSGTGHPRARSRRSRLCPCASLPSLGTPSSPARQRGRPAPARAKLAEASPGRPPGPLLEARPRPGGNVVTPAANKWGRAGRGVRPRRPGGEGAPAPASGRLPRRAPEPRGPGRRPGRAGSGAAPAGRGSPFWPLSAAYQESEKKAHRQKSSSVRKAPLRSLISSGTRWAPAGPRPHGPGGRGRSAGTGRLQGPRPRGGEGLRARGRAEVRAGLPGCGPGRAPRRRLLQAVGSGRPRLGARAGPGRAGLGWAARAAARPGSWAAAELAAKGGAAGT